MLRLLKAADKMQNARLCLNFYYELVSLHSHFTEQCVFYLATSIYINIIPNYIILYNEDILTNKMEKSIKPPLLSKAVCF